jgi:charged multivesicular body protein 4
MWSLFGGGQAANKKKQDAAKNSIVKLREQVTMLEKKEAHLQKQIDDLTAVAKRNDTTNKKGSPRISLVPGLHTPIVQGVCV